MITKHPTLFSRDSKGKVRIWRMETEGNKFRTVSGLEDGEQVTSDFSLAEGKNTGKANETTDEEQALKEVESRYKKQLKTGYHESITDIDKQSYISPMLAANYNKEFKNIKFESGKWIGQCKFNGIRMVASKAGLFTREGEPFVSVPHIAESLKPFFALYPDAVLDGECFNEELRQNLAEIVHLARKSKLSSITKEEFAASKALIRFYVYDGYGFNNALNESVDYETRKAWIDKNVTSGQYEFLKSTADYPLNSEKEFSLVYGRFIADSHEGIILRDKTSGYEHKRAKCLVKAKPDDTDDFYITDIKEGSGNWSGKAKIISLKSKDGKMEFDASAKGTMQEMVVVLKEKNKWVGKLVEVKYNGFTVYSTPNFATVDFKNCLKGDR